jgi:hypothetical protein
MGKLRKSCKRSSMTQNSFDQFSKQYLEEFLSPYGTIEISREVLGEPLFVDVFFMPAAPAASIAQDLGLLGRIAQTPCLIEPFRNSPTLAEVRNCLQKLFHVHGDMNRRAKQEKKSLSESELPTLWILVTSASKTLLSKANVIEDKSWPTGVYFISELVKTAIVSINQIPQTEDTLWLRILGRGETQQQALTEVLSFNQSDPKRLSILKLLATWKINLELSGELEQEQGLTMVLSQAYLEWEQQTELRGKQSLVLRLLNRRVGVIEPDTEAKVRVLSLSKLEELGEALLDFSQPSDLNQWLATNA